MKRKHSFDNLFTNKLAALYIVVLSGLVVFFAAGTAAAQDPGSEDSNNWPQYHRTYNGWRYSPLDQINKANVSKLKIAWIHQGGDITMGLQETPIVIDGVVYSITAGNRVAGSTPRISTSSHLGPSQPLMPGIGISDSHCRRLTGSEKIGAAGPRWPTSNRNHRRDKTGPRRPARRARLSRPVESVLRSRATAARDCRANGEPVARSNPSPLVAGFR
jgi:hypothetical protein